MVEENISFKTNRVLNIILLALLLILIRVWHLAVVQHEEHLELAHKPQRRVMIEHVDRATIRDRFNIPLAMNRIQYNAAISYAEIREIPGVEWKKDENGKPVRVQSRSVYIRNLSDLLAKELHMDPVRIQDTIHGKASLFPHTPFVIKEDISEETYYRLLMLRKDWAGIEPQRTTKRFYPQGKVGADIIGYLGAISPREYSSIAQEMKELQGYLNARESGELVLLPKGYKTPLEVRERLKSLQERSYTINDLVGKSGVEGVFDEELRGFYGKKMIEVDVKGNFLRELPGSRKATSGQRILLTLSSELQEFAESLLMQNEATRDKRDPEGKFKFDSPWIKGGAIVAILPKTGEVVALASYPRIDGNDFIPSHDPDIQKKKHGSVIRWLETEAYVAELWDGKRALERELISKEGNEIEESLPLTWERYLECILPSSSSVKLALAKVGTIKGAVHLQEEFQALLKLSEQEDARLLIDALYSREKDISLKTGGVLNPAALQAVLSSSHKKTLDRFLEPISYNQDKLLLLDLCRLLTKKEDFSEPLLAQVGQESLSSFRTLTQHAITLQTLLRPHVHELFHKTDFAKWRAENFKNFLKEKRREEREKKQYARPYPEYLDLLEKQMFKAFWKENRHALVYAFLLDKTVPETSALFPYTGLFSSLKQRRKDFGSYDKLKERLSSLSPELALSLLQTMRGFDDLTRPLFGKYPRLRHIKGVSTEKHLASAFYPLGGFSYGRSQTYRQSSPLGSVFKLVTAYTALQERYHFLKERGRSLDQLNPLTLTDDLKGGKKISTNSQILGYTSDGQPITRQYKGGRLPRSSHAGIGRIDILGALEQSSNVYFALAAGEHIEKPQALSQAARLFGFGQKTGIDLFGETSGTVPDDISYNRTGLYSFAIGQHSLVVSPLQTALMVSSLVNKGKILKPQIVKVMAGKEQIHEEEALFSSSTFAFQEELERIGISFPLFTSAQKEPLKNRVYSSPVEVTREISLPKEVRSVLMEGMQRVLSGSKGTARPDAIRYLVSSPKIMRDYLDLHHQVVGKTGTAEILYKHTIDAESLAEMTNHVWFAGASFDPTKPKWEEPELVVVVFLRFGERGGKEGAPIALQVIKKWREIVAKH